MKRPSSTSRGLLFKAVETRDREQERQRIGPGTCRRDGTVPSAGTWGTRRRERQRSRLRVRFTCHFDRGYHRCVTHGLNPLPLCSTLIAPAFSNSRKARIRVSLINPTARSRGLQNTTGFFPHCLSTSRSSSISTIQAEPPIPCRKSS